MAGAERSEPFGLLLRQFRLRAGLTQDELAEQAGISARGLQYLETGGGRPRPDTMRRLAEALGLDTDERAELDRARRARASAAPTAASTAGAVPAAPSLPTRAPTDSP